jgi:hypothetical protein
MKRDATKVIWRTVVFAGAMLGAPACGKKPAPQAPQNTANPVEQTQAQPAASEAKPDPCAGDPCAGDPCAGRVRGADDDGGGGVGRGFVLS